MKEKNKGFTLIELLAVIVILAIIALIATPIVMNLLNKSRQKSAENSAYSYIKAIEYYIGLSELEMNPKRLEAGKCYNVNDSTIINEEATEKLNNLVDIKGSRPTGLEDRLCFDEKYTVKEGILTINGYTIEIKNGKVVGSVKGAKINVLDFTLNVDSEISMENNATLTIKANSFEPSNASNQKLLFESKNTNIITVDSNGIVTALKNGEGTIVVTSEDNSKIKKEIKITVVSPQDIKEIEISKVNETEELYVGKYLELKATIKPSDAQIKTLTWASNNENIVTINETGKVFGVSVGKTTITATSESKVTAEFEIEVKEKFAESITISGTDEIVLGETTTLTATVNPDYTTDKTVTWSSSDSNIATVDSTGKVTGKSIGTATITAASKNGVTGTIEITVKEILAESITISGSDMLGKGETIMLTAVISPSDTTNKTVTWSSSDSNIATVDSTGKVTSKNYGSATITVTASNGKQATKQISVYGDFSIDSWSTIIANVNNGKTSTYKVGDTKTIDMGTLGTHTVRIANTTSCTSSLKSKTACGFVIEFADVITTGSMRSSSTNYGGWPLTNVRSYLNSTIYNTLPSDLRNGIIDTTVISGYGGDDSGNFESIDKLYLLSTAEVYSGGQSNDTAKSSSITRQLDYYRMQGVTTSSYSAALKSGCSYWWLRTAYSTKTGSFYSVNYGRSDATNSHGISPAFRLSN